MCGKFKLSVRKFFKYLSQCIGVSKSRKEIIQSKNWQSALLLMKEDKYFWFIIHRISWKANVKVNFVVINEDQIDAVYRKKQVY